MLCACTPPWTRSNAIANGLTTHAHSAGFTCSHCHTSIHPHTLPCSPCSARRLRAGGRGHAPVVALPCAFALGPCCQVRSRLQAACAHGAVYGPSERSVHMSISAVPLAVFKGAALHVYGGAAVKWPRRGRMARVHRGQRQRSNVNETPHTCACMQAARKGSQPCSCTFKKHRASELSAARKEGARRTEPRRPIRITCGLTFLLWDGTTCKHDGSAMAW